jgi:hypothetical protein
MPFCWDSYTNPDFTSHSFKTTFTPHWLESFYASHKNECTRGYIWSTIARVTFTSSWCLIHVKPMQQRLRRRCAVPVGNLLWMSQISFWGLLIDCQWTNAIIVVERVAARWAFVTVGIAPRLFCYDCESCVTVVHIPLAPLMGIVKDQWKDVSNVKIGRNNIRSCWQCRESICLDCCVRHDSNVRGYFLACFFCDNCWNDMDSVRSNA